MFAIRIHDLRTEINVWTSQDGKLMLPEFERFNFFMRVTGWIDRESHN